MAVLKNRTIILAVVAVVVAVVDQLVGTHLLPTVLQAILGGG